MVVSMYALHKKTCVYEVKVESFFRHLQKCYVLVHLFFTNGKHTCIKVYSIIIFN